MHSFHAATAAFKSPRLSTASILANIVSPDQTPSQNLRVTQCLWQADVRHIYLDLFSVFLLPKSQKNKPLCKDQFVFIWLLFLNLCNRSKFHLKMETKVCTWECFCIMLSSNILLLFWYLKKNINSMVFFVSRNQWWMILVSCLPVLQRLSVSMNPIVYGKQAIGNWTGTID